MHSEPDVALDSRGVDIVAGFTAAGADAHMAITDAGLSKETKVLHEEPLGADVQGRPEAPIAVASGVGSGATGSGERDQADRYSELHEGADLPGSQGAQVSSIGRGDAKEDRGPGAALAADGRDSNPEQQRVLVPVITQRCQRLEGADEPSQGVAHVAVAVVVGAGSGDGEDGVGRIGPRFVKHIQLELKPVSGAVDH